MEHRRTRVATVLARVIARTGGLAAIAMLAVSMTNVAPAEAQPSPRLIRGREIAPVPLDLAGKDPFLVALGSYLVNAGGGCNDCHTNPPFAPGGDPYLGEPKMINTEGYLGGGVPFGPFISRNITPCDEQGRPGGLTFPQFLDAMRNGTDHDADDTPILQIMPWPIYGEMIATDLRAVYEYLRAIPPLGESCAPLG